MAWRATPRGLRAEFDEMLADMQRQFTETMERISGAAQQVPLIGGAGTRVDVREHETDVVVVADLPGVERQMISVRLLDPRTLRIAARREETQEAEEAGYYMRERKVGAISRTATLPTDVTEEGARATFKNGVLEVRLKKVVETYEREIAVTSEPHHPGRSFAEEQRQREMERSREAQEETRPAGHLRPREEMEEAKSVELEERGSPEEQATAARIRRRKEELYEEAKRRFT